MNCILNECLGITDVSERGFLETKCRNALYTIGAIFIELVLTDRDYSRYLIFISNLLYRKKTEILTPAWETDNTK
jgi:hypothetical protein